MKNSSYTIKMVIRKRLLILFLLMISLPTISAVSIDQNDCLYYFYADDCIDCNQANDNLRYLETRYQSLQVTKYEVYYNRENARNLEKYFDAYNIPPGSRGIPVVFLENSYFIGAKTIKDMLENRIKDNNNVNCPALDNINAIGLVGRHQPYKVIDTITIDKVTRDAISDSIRPGMVAYVLVLLIFLAFCRKKEDVLRNGIVGIITLFLISLSVGMGIIFKGYVFFPKFIGILTIIGSLVRIKGFFGTWRIFSRSLSEELEQKIRKTVNYLISPIGSVLLSIIMAIFSFGVTSEMFTLLRTLAIEGVGEFRVFSLIFYISLITIIPSAITVGIVYGVVNKLEKHAERKGTNDQRKFEKWRKHTQSVFNFVVSSLMLLFGFILLFY
jgi:glutaredoxin